MNSDVNTIAEKSNYIPAVDGLRGIAILMVLAVHSSQFIGNDHAGSFRYLYMENIVNSGARGVQLFFMVSAFTLFSSSYKRFKVDTFPKTSFYLRRAFRILPFWWLMLFIIGIERQLSLRDMLPSLLFYFGFIRYDSAYNIIPQGWSLFVEECFYILLPIIFKYISSLKRSIIFTIMCSLVYLFWTHYAKLLGVPSTNDFIFLFPLTNWYCFAIGIFIFHVNINYNSYFQNIKRWKIHLLDALVLMTMATLIFRNWIVASFSLMLFFIVALDNRTFICKIVCNRLLIRFGGCCYSIYLFHLQLLNFISPFINNAFRYFGLDSAFVELKFLIIFVVTASLSLGLGTISFRLIEKPCVELGKRVISAINSNKSINHDS